MGLANSCQWVLWACWAKALQGSGHPGGHRYPDNSGGSQSCSGPHFHLCCHLNSEAVPALSPAHPHSQFGLREEQLQLPPPVHQQLQAVLRRIWHCSDVLLWLLRRHSLHRSAWKSFRQIIWDRMQLWIVHLRPGTSVWTHCVGDNGFFVFPWTWDLEKH